MTRSAGGDGANKNSRQPQRPTAKAGRQTSTAGGYIAPVFAVVVIAFSFCLDVAHSFSSTTVPCPSQLISCIGNEECNNCLATLQDDGFLNGGDNPEVCSELYGQVCATADFLGCDTENEELIDFLTCVAEDIYGCTDFPTCAEATAGAAATPAPTATATTAATPAPAPTFSTPTLPLPTPAPAVAPAPATTTTTPAPSPSSTGGEIVPTAAPTTTAPSDGSRAIDNNNTSYPSAAPSAASAAPTGFDGSRGGGQGMFSATPTASPSASPTVFEDPSSLLDENAVNGGVVSRFAAAGSSAFFSTVSAAAMVGTFVAVVATAAVAGWGV